MTRTYFDSVRTLQNSCNLVWNDAELRRAMLQNDTKLDGMVHDDATLRLYEFSRTESYFN